LEQYVDKLHQALESAFSAVRQKSRKSAEENKRRYDKKARIRAFSEGQLVLLRREPVRLGLYTKWVRKYEGPFQILKKLGEVNYLIRRRSSGKESVAHVDRLREWRVNAPNRKRNRPVVNPVADDISDDGLLHDPIRRSRRTAERRQVQKPTDATSKSIGCSFVYIV
jgi:hypothetical protein